MFAVPPTSRGVFHPHQGDTGPVRVRVVPTGAISSVAATMATFVAVSAVLAVIAALRGHLAAVPGLF